MTISRSFSTNGARCVGLEIVSLAIAVWAACGVAQAQQDYKQMQLNAENSSWGKVLTSNESASVVNMCTGADPFNKQTFDAFFKNMLFPTFTQYSDRMISGKMASPLTDRGGPAKMRENLKRKYADAAKGAQVHEELNNLTFEFMDSVANDNYHPLVRVNAMLMIADLNETDPNGAPWKNALPALLKAASDPKMIDGVRVEALRGLERHAKSGITPALRGQVTTAMLAIIGQHIPPAGRTQDGHDWICRRAIDVLAALGDAGPNDAVPQSLVAIVNDSAASVSIRCAAAEAIGMLKVAPPKNVDVSALAKSLARVAIAAVSAELTAKAPTHGPINVERLKEDFVQISRGLIGENGKAGVLTWTTDGTVQGSISLIDKAIKPLMDACDKQPLPQPAGQAGQGVGPVVPIDRQKPIVDALNTAVEGMKTVLERGEAGPAATAAPATPGKAAVPDFN
jgi:hypothetical protein